MNLKMNTMKRLLLILIFKKLKLDSTKLEISENTLNYIKKYLDCSRKKLFQTTDEIAFTFIRKKNLGKQLSWWCK